MSNLISKLLLAVFFVGFVTVAAHGQVYIRPKYANKSMREIELLRITITEDYTIVECRHSSRYGAGGWAAAMPDTFIRITGTNKRLKLIKAVGIPTYPDRHYYREKGEYLQYKLLFPPISPNTPLLDIIEIENSDKAFNFLKVQLTPIA